MDGNEEVPWPTEVLRLFPKGRNLYKLLAVVLLVMLLLKMTFTWCRCLLILVWFALGCSSAWYLIRDERIIDTLAKKFKKPSFPNSKKAQLVICPLCESVNCRRHNPEINRNFVKPWVNLRVPREVDEALEEILNLVIERNINSWYSSLTCDKSFVQETRVALRFLFATLMRRALQVDLVQLITVRIANCLFQHLECYLKALKQAKSPHDIESAVLSYLGNNLHPAMENRQSELAYLRQLTENLIPLIVQKKNLQCRSACCLVREIFCNLVLLPVMDIIADPDIVNHLLVIFFDKTPMVEYPDDKKPKVEFLSNFVEFDAPSQEAILHTELRTVLEDQSLLYLFMSFLKDECSINILQFLLAVDDFSSRILNPDLSKNELEALHLQAQEIFNTYFSPSSIDHINFSDELTQEFKELISDPPENVIKLRTTTPLFHAYDYAYALLEETYCPIFFQSDKYFNLICGERCSVGINRSSGRGSKRPNAGPSPISKLGNKIKGVFVSSIDEGQIYEPEAGTELAESLFVDVDLPSDGTGDIYRMDNDPRLKKLSAWRVFIPRVVDGSDKNCEHYYAFDIEVQRIDVQDNDNPEDLHWKIERKYVEFYVLETKLTEFHGELPIQLPPKRSQYQKGMKFLENRRPELEKFLQTLLTLPSLQGSELLYTFLRTPVPFTSSFLADMKLGRMIKTVPRKLMKEKGQHLLPFLQAFLASTEAAKPKPSKMDWSQINDYFAASCEKLTAGIYNDNYASLKEQTGISDLREDQPLEVVDLKEIYDYIYYLAVEVVHVQDWIVELLKSCDKLLRQPLQALTEWYLSNKLEQVFKPQRSKEILNLLRDALFFDDDPPRTRHEKAERAKQSLKQAKDYFPNFLRTQRLEGGIDLLFDALQCPLLNKQISYVLLDIVAVELFPELQDTQEMSSSSETN